LPILIGACATMVVALAGAAATGPGLIARLQKEATQARDRAGGAGIRIDFTTPQGWYTRFPTLSGGDNLSEPARRRATAAIAAAPGIGGTHWINGGGRRREAPGAPGLETRSLHCQEDVQGILKTRSIRFSEASAAIDPASVRRLNEVAAALRPCVGSIIAVTGHTDNVGDPDANLALSRARAESVRWALVGRGIPADGLRATGVGASQPLEGLAPSDPANRRIEFSVIETVPLSPTPVDTPGPG
jgi:OOP family OmpA-OmpF porin